MDYNLTSNVMIDLLATCFCDSFFAHPVINKAAFDVLLTVHLSIFILVINQLDAQNLFYSKFISCLYMFQAQCAHRQEVKIILYSLWYHHTETSEWSKITKITKITKYINMST